MEAQAGAVQWELWLGSFVLLPCPPGPASQCPALPGHIPFRGFHSAMTMLPFEKTPPFQNLYFGNFQNANCFLNKQKLQNILF